MECTSSSNQHHHLPPGFRFHPTDEELIVHYLKKKASSVPLPVNIIAEIELYKYDPWQLPSKASFGEHEWYFFTPRDRKYPNGARPNRAATSGYWKATGTDKPIHTANSTQKVAVKKALVFYGGKPPKGIKSNWMMHEYRLVDNKPPGSMALNNRGSSRLDDWVLCRIFKKSTSQSRLMDHREQDESLERELLHSLPSGSSMNGYRNPITGAVKPADNESGLSFDNYSENYFPGILSENEPTTYHGNSVSIPQLGSTSSKPDFAKHTAMPGYWNGVMNGALLSSKQWVADQDEDKNNSAPYNMNTASFTSLINENSDNTADFKHNSTL